MNTEYLTLSAVSTSAPPDRSNVTTDRWPARDALKRAVLPSFCSSKIEYTRSVMGISAI